MEKILPKESNIRGILLSDGREIIAKTDKTVDGYTLTNPVLMITQQMKDGSWNVFPMPFSLIMPRDVPFKDHAISSVFPITKELEDGYLGFVTGIPVGNSLLQG